MPSVLPLEKGGKVPLRDSSDFTLREHREKIIETQAGNLGRSHSDGFWAWGGAKQTYQSITMASISLG